MAMKLTAVLILWALAIPVSAQKITPQATVEKCVGKPTPQLLRHEHPDAHISWTENDCKRVLKHEVWVGMTWSMLSWSQDVAESGYFNAGSSTTETENGVSIHLIYEEQPQVAIMGIARLKECT
jgi:hypothetical protein